MVNLNVIDLYSLRNIKTLTFDWCECYSDTKKINISHLQNINTSGTPFINYIY